LGFYDALACGVMASPIADERRMRTRSHLWHRRAALCAVHEQNEFFRTDVVIFMMGLGQW
jgi:hypothetical protein